MDKFEQEFVIKARKPIVDKNEKIDCLFLNVTSYIDTRKPLEKEELLWGLFIDSKYEPNPMKPLLLVGIPNSQLMFLNTEETNNIKREMKYYKNVQQSDSDEVGKIEIDKDEFYQFVKNDLHFMHEGNSPCQTYGILTE